MTGRNPAQERAMILVLLGDELTKTDTVYIAYPEGYNQGVVDANNRLYNNFVQLQFRGDVSSEVGRILIDSGLVKTVLRAYYCTRVELSCRLGSSVEVQELERPSGTPVYVKDAYVSIHGIMGMGRWRRGFGRMDPALARNKDLEEIMQNIQLDGNEERDLRRWA